METFSSIILVPNDKCRIVFRGVTFMADKVTEPVEVRISVDPVDIDMNFDDVHST